MDIRSFFGASISSFVASCRELIQPSTTKRKYLMNWENEFSWLEYAEDIIGAFCRDCKQTTAESATTHRRCLGHKPGPELEESYRKMKEVASTLESVKPW